jgi:tetratricopeptide (TPR) repeat protein
LSERFASARPAGSGAADVSLAGILPTPATPLAGWDQETRAVMDLVHQESVREVTLTGPGGVGKSRLAVEVAQRLEPGFADGVRFVDLTPVRAADLVAALACSALAHLLAEQHQDARAAELLEQTLAVLRGAGNDALTGSQRLAYLVDVSLACNFLGQIRLGQGDPEGAAQLFAAALRASRGAPDGFVILISLYDLALSSQAGGDLNGSAASLREGLSLAGEAGDGPSAAYYLEALAAAAQQQDMPERAVRLLAGADALLQAKGSGWLHAYVPRAHPAAPSCWRCAPALGDSPFEEAWAEGRSLGGHRAVQDALDEGQPGAASERP